MSELIGHILGGFLIAFGILIAIVVLTWNIWLTIAILLVTAFVTWFSLYINKLRYQWYNPWEQTQHKNCGSIFSDLLGKGLDISEKMRPVPYFTPFVNITIGDKNHWNIFRGV